MKITWVKGNNGNEYTEYRKGKRIVSLAQQSGSHWVVYRRWRDSYLVDDSTSTRERAEAMALKIAEEPSI